jgi:hypothetical protein
VLLPTLNESGELPPGVHQATLAEALDRFGIGSPQRKIMALRLERIYRLALATGYLRVGHNSNAPCSGVSDRLVVREGTANPLVGAFSLHGLIDAARNYDQPSVKSV